MSAYERLAQWATNGKRTGDGDYLNEVTMTYREIVVSTSVMVWEGTVRVHGPLTLTIVAGPQSTPEYLAEQMIARLGHAGIVVP